jgi:DNA-binding transcriptional ArsR family regulator
MASESGQWFCLQRRVIALHGASLGPHGIAVYTVLASQADHEGQVDVTLEQLSTLMGLSRRSIMRTMPRLLRVGLLTTRTQGRRQIYTLMPLTPTGATQSPVPHSHLLPHARYDI